LHLETETSASVPSETGGYVPAVRTNRIWKLKTLRYALGRAVVILLRKTRRAVVFVFGVISRSSSGSIDQKIETPKKNITLATPLKVGLSRRIARSGTWLPGGSTTTLHPRQYHMIRVALDSQTSRDDVSTGCCNLTTPYPSIFN
jgi:hypothetical protein